MHTFFPKHPVLSMCGSPKDPCGLPSSCVSPAIFVFFFRWNCNNSKKASWLVNHLFWTPFRVCLFCLQSVHNFTNLPGWRMQISSFALVAPYKLLKYFLSLFIEFVWQSYQCDMVHFFNLNCPISIPPSPHTACTTFWMPQQHLPWTSLDSTAITTVDVQQQRSPMPCSSFQST